MRVGKAIREEAESGNADAAIAEQERMVAEARPRPLSTFLTPQLKHFLGDELGGF